MGPESSSVINLTSGAFASNDPSKISSDTPEKLLNESKSAPQSGITDHFPQLSNSDTITATSSKDLGQLNSTTTCLNRADIDLPNKSMGPLSQSQIVNVNGRQFLILPLNDTNESDGANSNYVATVSQDNNNNNPELPR